MRTISIRLPESLAAEIESESLARRISKSDLVRERLSRPGSHDESRTLGAVTAILEKSWKAKVPVQPPSFRSPKKQKIAALIRGKKLYR